MGSAGPHRRGRSITVLDRAEKAGYPPIIVGSRKAGGGADDWGLWAARARDGTPGIVTPAEALHELGGDSEASG